MEIGFRRSFWHKSPIHSVSIFMKNGHVTVRRWRKKSKMNLEVLKPSVFHFESMFSSCSKNVMFLTALEFETFKDSLNKFTIFKFTNSGLPIGWIQFNLRTWNLFWTWLTSRCRHAIWKFLTGWRVRNYLTWPVSCRWQILSPTLSHRYHCHL